MSVVRGFNHFGGTHGESAAIRNLLAFAGVSHPVSGGPLSEALCFGIAGGIGAGYSFCPSVIRHGCGSGVSVVGRHKVYAGDATWYQGFCDRIGAKTRITETAAKGKAFANLTAELDAGRPAVVWCGRPMLPFLGDPVSSCGLWMHSFIVYGVDEDKALAYGSDRSAVRVSLTLDQLADARAMVCSHKNRTLTIDPPATLTADRLRSAVRESIKACAQELLAGRMKTFSLPGLEMWAKLICNEKNKDGWGKVFGDSLVYCALRDVYESIVTEGTGGDLFRGLYADFLDEAGALFGNPEYADLANVYRGLGKQWVELADAALPAKVKAFKQTRDLLHRRAALIAEKGEKGTKQVQETSERVRKLEAETRRDFPLSREAVAAILEDMRGRIEALHRGETEAAQRLTVSVRG